MLIPQTNAGNGHLEEIVTQNAAVFKGQTTQPRCSKLVGQNDLAVLQIVALKHSEIAATLFSGNGLFSGTYTDNRQLRHAT